MTVKKYVTSLVLLVVSCFALTACGSDSKNDGTYTQISQNDAKQIMDEEDDYIILDVRTTEEYQEEHIKGAINVPNETIQDQEPDELTNKDELILVYCRSGVRSKQAAQKLADMGYTNIKEFGGIITWKYETE